MADIPFLSVLRGVAAENAAQVGARLTRNLDSWAAILNAAAKEHERRLRSLENAGGGVGPAGPPGPQGPAGETGPQGPAGSPSWDETRIANLEARALRWRTAFDVDFTAQANQTLTTDGYYTIGGVQFWKAGTTKEDTAMAVINGTGLRMYPAQVTDMYYDYGAFRCPMLRVRNMYQLIPNLTWATPIRVWADMTGTADVNEKRMIVGGGPRGGGGETGGSWWGSCWTYDSHVHAEARTLVADHGSGATVTSQGRATSTTDRIHIVQWPSGLAGNTVNWLTSSDYTETNTNLWNILTIATPLDSTDRSWLKRLTNWEVFLAAYRNGAATSFPATFRRMRLEYLSVY